MTNDNTNAESAEQSADPASKELDALLEEASAASQAAVEDIQAMLGDIAKQHGPKVHEMAIFMFRMNSIVSAIALAAQASRSGNIDLAETLSLTSADTGGALSMQLSRLLQLTKEQNDAAFKASEKLIHRSRQVASDVEPQIDATVAAAHKEAAAEPTGA